MTTPPTPNPLLLEINTRVLLRSLQDSLGRAACLDDIPDSLITAWAEQGFDWIWMLSVWSTGPIGQQVSQQYPGWQSTFRQTLPDLTIDDIGGSGFAIASYTVSDTLGGPDALARLRDRLRAKGLKLMLDFVPNHMGPDHPWVLSHPEFFVQGTEADLQHEPQNYLYLDTDHGRRVFAHGRDPYFDGWPDTVQIDYSHPGTIEAMKETLFQIASQCDGVRCDMAMLPLPEVFKRTWGKEALPFWPVAIADIRQAFPGFTFMAEVYWDMEWTLQQLGFQYTYDKRLYDRLKQGQAMGVVQHLMASADFQQKSVRFLENHDEARAATAFSWPMHQAAAVVSFTLPGLRFFHDGQTAGFRSHISPHLVRGPKEPTDENIASFYGKLFPVLREPVLQDGRWLLLHCRPAWFGNESHASFVAFDWKTDPGQWLVVVVNYSAHSSQGYLVLPTAHLAGQDWRFEDLMSDAVYDREGESLQARGLYLDMMPWQYHIFRVTPIVP